MKHDHKSQALATRLRRTLTPPERLLWSCLKLFRGQGFHFRHQSAFGPFVLDFVCHSRRLVVEVDGSHHADEQQAEHDAVRDILLAREGYQVLRFPPRRSWRTCRGFWT